MKFLLNTALTLAGCFVAPSAFAGYKIVTGIWQGAEYRLTLQESLDEIYGSVNGKMTDLTVTTESIRGSLPSGDIDLKIRTEFSIYGRMPCGPVDYYYNTFSQKLYGSFCGKEFETQVDSAVATKDLALRLILEPVLREFPPDTQYAIRRFLLIRIKI